MEDSMNVQEKLALIKENLQEVLREHIIEDVLVKQNRPLKIYWGMYSCLRASACVADAQVQVRRQREGLTAATLYPWSSSLISCALDAP